MVNITQRDFNLDMDSYLSRKVKDDKPVPVKTDDPEKPKIEPDRTAFQKFVDMVIGQDEDIESEIVEETIPKQYGLLSAIKGWFSVSKDESELVIKGVEIDEPNINEDVKEVLKILNKWLTRLPPKTIAEFKNSDDYQKYKLTLQKYKLIKN